MNKKFKYWFSENWIFVVIVISIIFYGAIVIQSVSSPEVKQWFSKSVHDITCGDILIIAIVHAYINKSSINNKS